MYLSSLSVDTSAARGRTWLANPYRIHQRLLMAFPDVDPKANRVLFRLEDDRDLPRLLVQSDSRPDWDLAFRDHPVLASPPRCKEVTLALREGQRLRFRLRANPTWRKSHPTELDDRGKRKMGDRLGLLREEQQRAWLERKGQVGGFRLLDYVVRSPGLVSFPRGGDGAGRQTHVLADFEGHLLVTDPVALLATVASGVGSAKAFGFGLLSLAPA